MCFSGHFGRAKTLKLLGVTKVKNATSITGSSITPIIFFPIYTRSPQISDQNKSEAREPEGVVKITLTLSLAPF